MYCTAGLHRMGDACEWRDRAAHVVSWSAAAPFSVTTSSIGNAGRSSSCLPLLGDRVKDQTPPETGASLAEWTYLKGV